MRLPKIETPENLLESLKLIFPDYVYEEPDDEVPYPLGYHSIMSDFIHYFSKGNNRFSERQLQNFAKVVCDAEQAGGDLENAFDTCFLEHLHQIRALKPLTTYLSQESRKRAKG